MVQLYLITELFLLFAAAIILSDSYGARFPILFNLKEQFNAKPGRRVVLAFVGLLLVVGLCVFPMGAGPVVIGDLLPVVVILLLETRLVVPYGKKTVLPGQWLGFLCFWTAIIHFLLPKIVIL